MSKGNDQKKVWFAYPQDIRRAIDYALNLGQERTFMTAKPGEVIKDYDISFETFETARGGAEHALTLAPVCRGFHQRHIADRGDGCERAFPAAGRADVARLLHSGKTVNKRARSRKSVIARLSA